MPSDQLARRAGRVGGQVELLDLRLRALESRLGTLGVAGPYQLDTELDIRWTQDAPTLVYEIRFDVVGTGVRDREAVTVAAEPSVEAEGVSAEDIEAPVEVFREHLRSTPSPTRCRVA